MNRYAQEVNGSPINALLLKNKKDYVLFYFYTDGGYKLDYKRIDYPDVSFPYAYHEIDNKETNAILQEIERIYLSGLPQGSLGDDHISYHANETEACFIGWKNGKARYNYRICLVEDEWSVQSGTMPFYRDIRKFNAPKEVEQVEYQETKSILLKKLKDTVTGLYL